jgi:hypothetical protein
MKIIGQSKSEVRSATIGNIQVIAKLESQIGQKTKYLGESEKGKLQSQLMPNPNVFAIGNSSNFAHGHEQVQSIITLRSERQVDNKVALEEEDPAEPQGQEIGKDAKIFAKPTMVQPVVEDSLKSFIPKAPYPERLKALKRNAQYAEILEVFK